MLNEVLAICSFPIFFITSATFTSPALEEINVLSLDSVAFEPQAPSNSASGHGNNNFIHQFHKLIAPLCINHRKYNILFRDYQLETPVLRL